MDWRFFNFKVMVTPDFVRISFMFLFASESLSALALPVLYLKDKTDISTVNKIIFYHLFYLFIVIVVIPLLALILHAIYELTIIPFSILDTLNEIKDKLDDKLLR